MHSDAAVRFFPFPQRPLYLPRGDAVKSFGDIFFLLEAERHLAGTVRCGDDQGFLRATRLFYDTFLSAS